MDPITSLATAIDPSLLLDELGFDPLPWQRQLLRSTSDRILLCAPRQAGKSTATACLGIWTALHEPGALVLNVSASQRQGVESCPCQRLRSLFGLLRPCTPLSPHLGKDLRLQVCLIHLRPDPAQLDRAQVDDPLTSFQLPGHP